MAAFKGYNPWIFAIGALITPWPISFLLVFLMSSLPKKFPKFPSHIRTHSAFEGKNPVIASIMAALLSHGTGKENKHVGKGHAQLLGAALGLSVALAAWALLS